MALPPSDPKRHRRQQLRRALIGWIGGSAVLALFVLAVVLGGDEGNDEPETIPAHSAGLFDYHMTSDQFEHLDTGMTEGEVLEDLGKIGLPEGQTKLIFIELFPAHDESLVCSYWQISDEIATIARLCFSREDGALRQKLERDLSGGVAGEQTVRA
jgi:hypothetical protein